MSQVEIGPTAADAAATELRRLCSGRDRPSATELETAILGVYRAGETAGRTAGIAEERERWWKAHGEADARGAALRALRGDQVPKEYVLASQIVVESGKGKPWWREASVRLCEACLAKLGTHLCEACINNRDALEMLRTKLEALSQVPTEREVALATAYLTLWEEQRAVATAAACEREATEPEPTDVPKLTQLDMIALAQVDGHATIDELDLIGRGLVEWDPQYDRYRVTAKGRLATAARHTSRAKESER